MINLFNKQRTLYQEKMVAKVASYDYRYVRYHINYSVALVYVSEKANLSDIASYLRKSDEYVKLNGHLYALFLDCTDDEKGIKTSNKILLTIQAQFFSMHLYMAVVTASNYTDSFQMVHDLFDLIEYGINHNMNNILIDASRPVIYD
ncbi:MAG TPA: hypothetical protein VJA83_03955 [Sulfuricurvum sp.]|nr:hypothetical protein [Sulfuricurvum sp.]